MVNSCESELNFLESCWWAEKPLLMTKAERRIIEEDFQLAREAFETMVEQGSRLLAARKAIVRKAGIRLNLVFDSS